MSAVMMLWRLMRRTRRRDMPTARRIPGSRVCSTPPARRASCLQTGLSLSVRGARVERHRPPRRQRGAARRSPRPPRVRHGGGRRPRGRSQEAMIVVDASVTVLGLLSAGASRRVLAEKALAVPHLIDPEVAHALRRRVLAGEVGAQGAGVALTRWSRLGVRRFATVGHLGRVWQLRDNLSAYDATYVALAEGARVRSSHRRRAARGRAWAEVLDHGPAWLRYGVQESMGCAIKRHVRSAAVARVRSDRGIG